MEKIQYKRWKTIKSINEVFNIKISVRDFEKEINKFKYVSICKLDSHLHLCKYRTGYLLYRKVNNYKPLCGFNLDIISDEGLPDIVRINNYLKVLNSWKEDPIRLRWKSQKAFPIDCIINSFK